MDFTYESNLQEVDNAFEDIVWELTTGQKRLVERAASTVYNEIIKVMPEDTGRLKKSFGYAFLGQDTVEFHSFAYGLWQIEGSGLWGPSAQPITSVRPGGYMWTTDATRGHSLWYPVTFVSGVNPEKTNMYNSGRPMNWRDYGVDKAVEPLADELLGMVSLFLEVLP